MLQQKEKLRASKDALDGELKALPSEMENLPLLLTSNCVCKLRNCHAGTVRRARKSGLIKARRINARVFLYERDSVLRWLGFLPGETASAPAPPPLERVPDRRAAEAKAKAEASSK